MRHNRWTVDHEDKRKALTVGLYSFGINQEPTVELTYTKWSMNGMHVQQRKHILLSELVCTYWDDLLDVFPDLDEKKKKTDQ